VRQKAKRFSFHNFPGVITLNPVRDGAVHSSRTVTNHGLRPCASFLINALYEHEMRTGLTLALFDHKRS